MSCMPVSVLPSMERLSMVLLAFPQHAATTKIPQQPASPMVFERMAIFRAMLFSEYWIGRRDGSASSLAASPVTRSMPLANPPVTGLIWLPITRMPSIKLADAAPPPALSAACVNVPQAGAADQKHTNLPTLSRGAMDALF